MNQQFVQIADEIELESGRVLLEPTLSYRVFGNMLVNESTPVIWVCHALTANDDPFDWWPGLFGENDLFNPDDYTIICVNMIGSCYGSVGPLSVNPETGEPYFHDFPSVTVKDNAKAFSKLADKLGIDQIDMLIGASLGGQVALQWAVLEPERFRSATFIATSSEHSPWGIAFNHSQRLAIEADPTWGLPNEESGIEGMKVARGIALLSYRNYQSYGTSQSRSSDDDFFSYTAHSYQEYQGEKLAKRFNAISYHRLSQTMDSHDISRDFGSVEEALARLEMPVLNISMEEDILFPPSEQIRIARGVKNGEHVTIPTEKGHDGFLIETEKLSKVLGEFTSKNITQKESLNLKV